jgi:glycosyltransferase involved in cell wall biosynthesis
MPDISLNIAVASTPKKVGGQMTFYFNLQLWARENGHRVHESRLWTRKLDWIVIISSSRHIIWLIWQKALGSKIILRLDNQDSGYYVQRKSLRISVTRKLVSFYGRVLANKIIYQSKYAESLFKGYGFKTTKSIIVHNPVAWIDTVRSNQIGKLPLLDVILIEGAYDDDPTLAALLKVLASVKYVSTITICGLVGQTIGEELKDESKISFTGVIDHTQLRQYLRISHVYFAVERNPACSNSLIEALASGVPILAYDTGSNKELISEKTGFLIPGELYDDTYLEEGLRYIRDNHSVLSKNCVLRAATAHSQTRQFATYFGNPPLG